MLQSDVDQSLLLFRRQYLQLFELDFLAWPPQNLLRTTDAQAWIYKHLFDENRNTRLPPKSYRAQVMKTFVSKIQGTFENAHEIEVSGQLMSHLDTLISRGLPTQLQTVQENAYVTFTCLPHNGNVDEDASSEPTVTVLERRYLISGSRITGFRTWEASLHLGSYLLTEAGKQVIKGKNVLELGAGTGFLSLLCAKHLEASHVTTTDGDEGIVDALKENFDLNGLANEQVMARVLRWGDDLETTWVQQDSKTRPYDVVIGADITYDKVAIKALVATMHYLFNLRPRLRILISGVVRNADTFESFRSECHHRRFLVQELDFQAEPVRQQKALFYAAAVPIKILSISGPE